MKRILLFALLLFVFSAGYSQNNTVHSHSFDFVVITLMSIGVTVLIMHVFTASKSYKEEAKKEPPVHIINHFHVCGSTAHASSTAVNDRSVRSYDSQEDNSNKSEVTNSNGGRLANNVNQTPHQATVKGSELSDYVEGEDDESIHYEEDDEDEKSEVDIMENDDHSV